MPDEQALPSRIAFLGLGLVGGSIARALQRRDGAPELVAWSPSGSGPLAAHAEGVVDRVAGTPTEAVEGAGLVVLAGPPLAIVELLASELPTLRRAVDDGATLTDVASTKIAILEAADRARLPFVGGHPMAGRETSGFAAGDADLFAGRPWVVVPGAMAQDVDVRHVEALAEAVEARPLRMAGGAHDAVVAAISHLPLVAAAALVDAVAGAGDWPAARALAASGWDGMTRLARGDPDMGAGILVTNRGPVVERLRAYRAALDAWIGALERDVTAAGGSAALRDRLAAARASLDRPTDG